MFLRWFELGYVFLEIFRGFVIVVIVVVKRNSKVIFCFFIILNILLDNALFVLCINLMLTVNVRYLV